MKLCIVGFGAIGKLHAEHIVSTENAQLYAVCDIQKDSLDKASEKYDVVTYNDYDTCLDDENIECVHICTPHYLHFEMIEKALAKGKYVVCEKPVVMTKEELDKLYNLQGADRVCVVMQNRLNPCVVKMKEIISSGILGAVKAIKGIVTWERDADYYGSSPWRGKWATEGGGVLINQSIHTLDLMCYLAGEVNNVRSVMSNFSLPSIEVEDSCMARLEFKSGAVGVFFATNAYGANSPVELEVRLENGKMRYASGKLYVNDDLQEADARAVVGKPYWGVAHGMIFERFYSKGGYFGVEDVKNTMETVFAMYEDLKNSSKRDAV